jgi:hypothetical protein
MLPIQQIVIIHMENGELYTILIIMKIMWDNLLTLVNIWKIL